MVNKMDSIILVRKWISILHGKENGLDYVGKKLD